MEEEKKVNFDMSALNLKELIQVYDNIDTFTHFLEESKIVKEESEDTDE